MEKFASSLDSEVLEAFDPALRKSFEVHDDTAGLKDYSKVRIEKNNILLSGDATFATLQGEGTTIGMPCVFCRLHVCNLRCTWCDAFYTWNPDSTEFWTESKRHTFEECAILINGSWELMFGKNPDHQKRVIFSGGEPLIQKRQIDEVWTLLDYHHHSDYAWVVEIETNGTLMPTQYQLEGAQFNCSPKLSNSENHHHSLVKPKVLEQLAAVNSIFKFVCKDEKDLEEIEEKYLPHIYEDQIVIMPEGIVEEEITKHARALYEPVMDRAWRMTPRFQAIFADGARRGV